MLHPQNHMFIIAYNKIIEGGLSECILSLSCFAPFRDGTLFVPHGVPHSIKQTTKPIQSLVCSPAVKLQHVGKPLLRSEAFTLAYTMGKLLLASPSQPLQDVPPPPKPLP